MSFARKPAWATSLVLLTPSLLWAEESGIDSGDTAWMLTSSALVLMMTIPGLALFYGGLVRSKNVLSTLMHSFFCAAIVSVLWVLYGYSLAFGPDRWCGLVGGLDFVGLKSLINTSQGTIPALVFVMFQATFAIITPALISGTFAERMRFPAFALYMILWVTFIYSPLAHWVWGGGWITTRIGALDFAGGTVVHISSGISALVTAIYLGRRVGHGHEPMPPHNLPFTVMGASLLWVGWFGFNAGSALKSGQLASVAFINTNTAAAAAALGWLLAEWARTGKPTMLGVASGAVAGLVAITPGAGFVTPGASIVIGAIGGIVCYSAVSLKPKIGYDDALDVVGVHLVGGTIGALLTGVFATVLVNPDIPKLALGVAGGGPALLLKQFLAVVVTYLFAGIGTLVILTIVNAVFRLRPDTEDEIVGMDLSQHSERAYAIGGEPIALAVDGIGEPKPAMAPPVPTDRFAIALDNVDLEALSSYWRNLCQADGAPPTEEFKSVYRNFSTIRGNKFYFRSGDRENVRRNMESLFKGVSANVKATLAS
ncbi:MAG TPA: ammonium transporter [Phycisphaerae bacterium]|nr:ammonium transporter [Phycisphaerae bacterium]